MPRKIPLSIYLDGSLARDLDTFAVERNKPRSLVVEAALRAFQKKSGVDETGVVDDATRGKLRDAHDTK